MMDFDALPPPLDHDEIESRDLLRLYALDRLDDTDSARVEEHLMECGACFEQVESNEALRQGMQDVAVQQVAQAAVEVTLWHRLQRGLAGQRGWLAALFVVALVPSALWWQQRGQVEELLAPSAESVVVSLGQTRQSAGVSGLELRLGEASQRWTLQLELPTVTAPSYDVVMLDGEGRQVWSQQQVAPDTHDNLVISLHSRWLEPGPWSLRVSPHGESAEPWLFDLRIVP